jgi:type IV pilus assembly protein PilW
MTAMPRQTGFTLIECMIALTLGMLVIAAATALLLSAQQTYLAIDDSARIDDAGASALAALGAAIRQAAYADRSGLLPPPNLAGHTLFGIDNAALSTSEGAFDQHRYAGVNGSDALAVRFMTTDSAGKPDLNMQNCAGHTAKNQAVPTDADAMYDWSFFYIARDGSGEPELFCGYRAQKGNFSAYAIVRGVEAMQFLYGVDLNRDGLPDTFLQADAVNDADWAKVVAVSIALSVRGAASSLSSSPSSSRQPAPDATDGTSGIRHLFGAAYSAQHAGGDPGVMLDTARLKPAERNRSRRILRSMVMLRNAWPDDEG